MLNKLLEDLTGTRQRVIAIIPAEELTAARELAKQQTLLKLNTKAALAEYHFNHFSKVDAVRLVTEGKKMTDESTELFYKTERSQLLEAEYNRLNALEDELVTKLLAAHGIEYTDETSLDIATGEVSIDEKIDGN